MDAAKLLARLDEIERQEITLDSLMVIRHGHVVLDACFWPFERGMKHTLYSACVGPVSACNAALLLRSLQPYQRFLRRLSHI